MKNPMSVELIDRLAVLRELCPEMRFGQMLATLNLLAEDMTQHSLWEIEDEELLRVMDRFRHDLTARHQGAVEAQ